MPDELPKKVVYGGGTGGRKTIIKSISYALWWATTDSDDHYVYAIALP
jgi:hypothetical protein